MNYNETMEYIHSISWRGSRPGLERTRELLCKIGDPQDKLKFVHVAGTNGKGSFCAMLSSILTEAGYRCGRYTSPFVLRFNERMAINGEDISDDELCEITEFVKKYADEMQGPPTEFELITVIAMEYFARHNCDIVVLECGMGGRLDSTNVIKTPVLSVITGISLDHTKILGDTVEMIAAEKAGIIKPCIPVLWCAAESNCSAGEVIKKKAETQGSPYVTVKHDSLKINKTDLDGTVFDYGGMKDIKIPLLGTYQPQNAANVLTAVGILQKCGMKIDELSIREGLLKTVWHARFEVVSEKPLIICDGGHNPEGIDAAVSSIKLYFGEAKVNIITGVMADKNYPYMSERISTVANKVFCLTPNNPRALDAEKYASVFRSNGVQAQGYDSIEEAVREAFAAGLNDNIPTVSLGSLYMYGDVIASVRKLTEAES